MRPSVKYLLDAVYMTGTFVGSALIALNIGENEIAFWLYLFASIAGTILVLKSNISRSVLIVSGYYVFINILGIVRA